MKRIKSACIMQTLRFQQKEDSGLSHDSLLELNKAEAEKYKNQLESTKTRYVIDSETEESDGAVIIKIRKEFNSKIDVEEYFN